MRIYVPEKKRIIFNGIDGLFEKTCVETDGRGGTLTGLEIYKQVQDGGIVIEPFNMDQINPNSYNVRLGNELKVYTEMPLRFNTDNPTKTIIIDEYGYLLKPGVLYIGTTVERVYTNKFKPTINGRSSGGRLGIDIHKCAGFGDVGFNGQWTLEIQVTHPVVITPGIEIAQISFDTLYGDTSFQYDYSGRYNNQVGATPSKSGENKKGKFSDFYKQLQLKKMFESLINSKMSDKTPSDKYGFDYIDFDSIYEVTYDLFEGEEIRGKFMIMKDDKVVGQIYNVMNTDIYVRKIS